MSTRGVERKETGVGLSAQMDGIPNQQLSFILARAISAVKLPYNQTCDGL